MCPEYAGAVMSSASGPHLDPAVYLDHAATTPMVPEAIAVMTEELARTGNASSLHASGRAARRTVEEARELIADTVRRPAQRGGLLLRRHRGQQSRDQGALLGPARRPIPRATASSSARSSTTPCSTRSPGWPSTRVPRST